MTSSQDIYDEEYDIVVVGSGGAGLTAALVGAVEGLSAVVLEKSGEIGGTTALSSGTLWVPGYDGERGENKDAAVAAVAYLEALVGDKADRTQRAAFLKSGPEMIRYLAEHSLVRFRTYPSTPDYHQHLPGASLGGQAHEPLPFQASVLGSDFSHIRPPLRELMLFDGMMVTRGEAMQLLKLPWSFKAIGLALRLGARYVVDRLRFRRGARLVIGNALVGRLYASLKQRGVAVRRNQTVLELLREGDRVTGVLVGEGGYERRIRARGGVVLAGGGFPANLEWRKRYLPEPTPQFSPAASGCVGETIQLALDAGGELRFPPAGNGLWFPSSVMERRDGSLAVYPHIVLDRAKPGLLAVNHAGRRFANEAVSYHAFGEALLKAQKESPTIPAALICDSTFIWKYGLGVVRPKNPFLQSYIRNGYLKKADTIAELAGMIGVDPKALTETIKRYNGFAATGVDTDFGRGGNPYDRSNGDPDVKPNPCLAPIEKGPFYAVMVMPTPLGTALGLKASANGEVLNSQGGAVDGLYVCGNDMSSIMGGEYIGPGGQLGPGMTFAYLAARHMSRRLGGSEATAAPSPD